jgi:Tol biopolymer transport system component/DNA-binding winged helix-turn-helix (wHTH) protein
MESLDVEVERQTAFRIGDWTVDPETNALIREDVERHVEPKVMRVLLTLAQRQNHVFSKEELISAVWPDTFVSDDALTRCVSILRRITEDDPHSPRFIQTVPKRGYRLIASVSDLPIPNKLHDTVPHPAELTPETPSSIPWIDPASTKSTSDVSDLQIVDRQPRAAWPYLVWGAVLLCLMGAAVAGVFWFRTSHRKPPGDNFRTLSFTSGAGDQTEAAFSPDGKKIAFVRTSENDDSRRICLKRIGSEIVTELTHDNDEQFSPAWSPSGQQIAYFSRSASGLGLFLADVSGKVSPRRLFIPQEPSHWEQGALSWSPDGKNLIFPDHPGTSASSSIFRLSLDTLRLEQVTNPPASWEGDLNPEYSPDGRYIAFTRASETALRDIYWISLSDGVIHQLTHDHRDINSLAWRRDSRTIVFSSDRGGKFSLWELALTQQQPQRLPVGTDDAFGPAVGPLAGQLAYSQGTALWSIERIERNGSSPSVKTIIASTEEDSAPSVAPDGKAFAFQSQRSGSQEIWIASTDGGTLRQLTFNNGPITGSPAWSHRGDQILFDSRPDEHSHIFVVPASGGAPRQITFGNVNDIVPRWSTDDQTVYFRSNRGDRWQIWRISIHGGEPQPVTSGDGIAPEESFDGKTLYYTRGGEPGLWSVPSNGGVETQIQQHPEVGYWGYFQVLPEGILYLDNIHSHVNLRLYNPATKQSSLFAPLEHTPPQYQGLSATANGKLILMTGERDAGQHITLVEAK